MTVKRVAVPESLPVGSPPSRSIVDLALKAVEELEDQGPEGINPPPPGAPSASYPVYLSPRDIGRIKRWMRRHAVDGSLGSVVGRLAWTAHAPKKGGRKKRAEASARRSLLEEMFGNRPDQMRYHDYLHGGLARGRITLAEGGTGVGKGRVAMALAEEYASGSSRAVVCSHAIQGMAQLLKEMEMVRRVRGTDKKVAFVFGRGQFVSSKSLLAWLDDEENGASPETVESVRAWIAEGAGRVARDTRVFHDRHAKLAWLREDLAELAPEVPVDELLLEPPAYADDTEDEAERVYRTLHAAAKDAHVIVTTHAAVVWDHMIKHVRNGRGLLPDFDTLLIDEAHTFASTAEQSFSKSIAFRSLEKTLRDGGYWKTMRCKGDANKARQVVARERRRIMEDPEIARIFGRSRDRMINPDEVPVIRDVAGRLRDALAPLVRKSSPNGRARAVHQAWDLCQNLTGKDRQSYLVRVGLSPMRGYPLTAGPKSLEWMFRGPLDKNRERSGGFWDRFARVGLLSATLYLPLPSDDRAHGLLSASLHFPMDRVKAQPPVNPDWLYNLTVYTPERSERGQFRVPMKSDYKERMETDPEGAMKEFDEDMYNWHQAVAERILLASSSAAGGMLVLATSYKTISSLSGFLCEAGLRSRIVAQKPGGFRQAHAEYRDRHRAGIRPIWLATGPAWVGLDLSEDPEKVPPEQDTLLTDLVIPRIPFGVDRTSAHVHRKRTYYSSAERDRAAFQFRQGVGRLIRRPGVRDRRLWILDSRIWTGNVYTYGVFRALLNKYPQADEPV